MKARRLDGKTETDVRAFVLSCKLSPQALLETHGESVPIFVADGVGLNHRIARHQPVQPAAFGTPPSP